MTSVETSQPNRLLRGLEAIIVVVAALYFGRPLLVPLALALLLTFLLTPAVSALEHRGLHRLASVGLVVALIFSGSAIIAWRTVEQLSDLVVQLPDYRANLHNKIQSFEHSDSRTLRALERAIAEVGDEFRKTNKKAHHAAEVAESTDAPEEPAAPLAVRVVPEPVNPLAALQVTFGALAAPLAQAGLVTVLVIFMLCAREDVRNRCVRLAGTGRVTLTTRTLDEMSTRISRYLLFNALVNGGFGIVIGLGLFALGVKYAMLWGFLAAVLRFVPYLGAVVASILPIGMAIIQFPTWTQPLLVATMFIVVELITNNVIEPLTYGKSGGVSTVALLVATIFWSWVWGPVGLVLSVPLTVMLAVLGKYVRPLEPLWILLGDHPPLPPDVQLYQRLLAGDSEEAAEVVEEFARTHTPLEICDQLLVPMLAMAKRDRGRGEMGEPLQSAVWATTQQLLDEYGEPPTSGDDDVEVNEERKVRVVGVPAADHGDELAIEMLRRAAPPIVDFQVVPLVTLASELIEILIDAPAQAVCIAALGPGGVGQTRYLCKRIRQHFPEVRIIVCRCGYQGEVAKMAASLQARGASQVTTSLHEVVDVLQRTQPLVATAAVAR